MPVAQQHFPKRDILIVDDTQSNVQVLSKMLAHHGFTVHNAPNGSAALSLAATDPPDLILLDILMPDMDGYTVCKTLKANRQTSDIPVIFLSALEDANNKIQGFDEGGIDYITKPFEPDEVLARVRAHLALHDLQHQLEVQNGQLQHEVAIRRQVEAVLQKTNSALEQEIAERTAALTAANATLKAEIAERARAEAALKERVRFETLLANLSATLVNLSSANADTAIVTGMQHVSDFFACDAYVLIEFSTDRTELVITHPADPLTTSLLRQDRVSTEMLPWFTQQLLQNQMLVMPNLLNDLPAEAVAERAYCQRVGARAGFAIPLVAANEVLGAVLFCKKHDELICCAELAPRLRIVGEILANALQRKRMEIQLHTYTQQLEMMVNDKVRELEQTRAKMIQTAKLAALGEMATGVAHELNQPMTAMLFEAEYLKTIAQQTLDAGENTCFLDAQELYHIGNNLAQDIQRSRRITDYLRAFSALTKDNVVHTNINHVIESSFMLTSARLSQRGIHIERQLLPQIPPIQANPRKLEQVFTNLISNAEYALEEMARRVAAAEVSRDNDYQKTLTISTYVEDEYVVARVGDNGCGIPQAACPHIFEPFFTTKPVGEGSGLGLSSSHGFVTEAGGQIDFESTENVGTTFTLRFPLAMPESGYEPHSAPVKE